MDKTYDSAAELLVLSNFDQVETMLAAARQRGAWSPALSSLEAQVIRRMPAPLALAQSGRLMDFGYDVGGVTPRALPDDFEGRLKSAQSALADAGEADVRVLLNRGHVLLSLRKAEAARRAIEDIEAAGGGWTFAKLTIANAALRELGAAEAGKKRKRSLS